MQTFYSGYMNTGKMKPVNTSMKGSSQGYFVRSESRQDGSTGERYRPSKKKGKKSAGDILFLILTIICLFVLFPVGVVMLWTRKVRMGAGSKLLLTILGAVVFLLLLWIAAGIQTDNPKIQSVQNKINGAYGWVYGKTGKGLESVLGWFGDRADDVKEKAGEVWEGVEPVIASEAKDLLGDTAENVSWFKLDLPVLLLDKYKEMTGYEPPEETRLPEKKDNAGVTVTAAPTAEATPAPAQTDEPGETPEPTPAPSLTPEPTKEPVVLPKIKDVALAPVYYTKNGTWYHLTENSCGMIGGVSHTLEEAQKAGKKVCPECAVTDYAILSNKDLQYLWVDSKSVAHCSDECAEFADRAYRIVSFDEVYTGHYIYCSECGSEIVHQYMQQKDNSYNVSIEEADVGTQLLYKAEQATTVYYGINSRYYHANRDCQQMFDDKYVHNLFEALHKDGMRPCPTCDPQNEGDIQEELLKK